MANEKRLTCVDELVGQLRSRMNGDDPTFDKILWHFCEILEAAPTVDAVEVVRCKDCKHRKEWLNGGTFYCQNPDFGMASGVALQDNDFCSYGERKTET